MEQKIAISVVDIFKKYSISLNTHQIVQFEQFLQLFQEYNAHTNLSAIREAGAILEKHFVDSAVLTRYRNLNGLRILDIGTGGGFPGIPLKIFIPSIRLTLLDSVGKKIKACESFIKALGLTDCTTHHARAETLIQLPGERAGYDMVVSRATAFLPEILAWSAPFISPT